MLRDISHFFSACCCCFCCCCWWNIAIQTFILPSHVGWIVGWVQQKLDININRKNFLQNDRNTRLSQNKTTPFPLRFYSSVHIVSRFAFAHTFFSRYLPFYFYINFIRGFCVFISKLCIQIEIHASTGWTGSSHDYLLYALYHHSFTAWGRQNDFQDVFHGGKVAIYVERWRKYVASAR